MKKIQFTAIEMSVCSEVYEGPISSFPVAPQRLRLSLWDYYVADNRHRYLGSASAVQCRCDVSVLRETLVQ